MSRLLPTAVFALLACGPAALEVDEFDETEAALSRCAMNAPSLVERSHPSGGETMFTGVNSANVMVGQYTDANDATRSFRWAQGRAHDLVVPRAANVMVHDIDGSGRMVGSFEDAQGSLHGFVARDGVVNTVDYPRAEKTSIDASAGTRLAGTYMDASGKLHGFVRDSGQWRSFDVPGDQFWIGGATQRLVVGTTLTAEGVMGFTWDGASVKLTAVPGATATSFEGIFGSCVVGNVTDARGTHALVGELSQAQWRLVDYPGALTTSFLDTSDTRAVGYFIDADGLLHGLIGRY